MLTSEENDLLTLIGPGTPMGDVFRRFWLPIAVLASAPCADGSPVRLKILHEDLVLFCDSHGTFGLVDAYCPHRGAPLEYGRNEDCGLRCIYHGWKFDVNGQCVDMPNVAHNVAAQTRQRITSYPVVEQGGMLWTYMGPTKATPPFPHFAFRDRPSSDVFAKQFEIRANWLQTVENEFDFAHGAFLHSAGASPSAAADIVGVELSTEHGIADFLRIEDFSAGISQVAKIHLGGTVGGHMIHYLLPCFMAVGVAPPGVDAYNLRTPVDDDTTMMFRVRASTNGPLDPGLVARWRTGGYEFPRIIAGTHRPEANRANRYLHDPLVQSQFNYSGVTGFVEQDLMMVEDLWGRRADRTREHLVASDLPVIRLRRRLLELVQTLRTTGELAAPMTPEGYAARQMSYLFERPEDFDRDKCLAELDARNRQPAHDAVRAQSLG